MTPPDLKTKEEEIEKFIYIFIYDTYVRTNFVNTTHRKQNRVLFSGKQNYERKIDVVRRLFFFEIDGVVWRKQSLTFSLIRVVGRRRVCNFVETTYKNGKTDLSSDFGKKPRILSRASSIFVFEIVEVAFEKIKPTIFADSYGGSVSCRLIR